MPINIKPENRARIWLQQQKSIPTGQGDVLMVAGRRVLGPFADQAAAKAELEERNITDPPHFFSLEKLRKLPRLQDGGTIALAVKKKRAKARAK